MAKEQDDDNVIIDRERNKLESIQLSHSYVLKQKREIRVHTERQKTVSEFHAEIQFHNHPCSHFKNNRHIDVINRVFITLNLNSTCLIMHVGIEKSTHSSQGRH